MSPRVKPRPNPPASTHTLAENSASFEQRVSRRYMTARPSAVTGSPLDLLDQAERRVLSKASNGAGGFLAPSSLYERIVEVRRQRDS